MHGTSRTRTQPAQPTTTRKNAVVWMGQGRALVVRDAEPGGPVQAEIALPLDPTATPAALAEVAHRIGSVDRVLVLGPDDLRTALEREIVAIGHAPETIREATVEGPLDLDILLEKLRRLA